MEVLYPLENTAKEIYLNYYKRVYNYIYGMVLHRETAEDLTGAVFIAVLEDWMRITALAEDCLAAWLFTVARNKVLNHLQKASTCREEARSELPETAVHAEPLGDLSAPETLVGEFILERLTLEERELLELRYSWGMTNKDIARLGNTNENTVSHRYQRLLVKCRKIYREYQQAK